MVKNTGVFGKVVQIPISFRGKIRSVARLKRNIIKRFL